MSDAMADLESNLASLRLMHESLKRFGESFASFLYGLEVNAFCVDFPEAPIKESWGLARAREELASGATGVSVGGSNSLGHVGARVGESTEGGKPGGDETTFMCVCKSHFLHIF